MFPLTKLNPATGKILRLIERNRLDPVATMYMYDTEELALEAKFQENNDYKSLNGTWKFNWVKSPDDRPYWFFKDDYDVRDWDEIEVPSNWERKVMGFRYILMSVLDLKVTHLISIITGIRLVHIKEHLKCLQNGMVMM